jgi:hypothetical protein
MGSPDRSKCYPEKVKRHAQDSLSHGDVEILDDRLDTRSIAGDAECPDSDQSWEVITIEEPRTTYTDAADT